MGLLVGHHLQPVLHLAIGHMGEELTLHFSFADPVDSSPLPQLSSVAFNAFVDQFADDTIGVALAAAGYEEARSRGLGIEIDL